MGASLSVNPMKQVSIRPVWAIQDPDGPTLAARALGLSYRRAWDLVREGARSSSRHRCW